MQHDAQHRSRPPRPRLREARARGLERVSELAEQALEAGAVANPRERRDVRAAIEYQRELLVWLRTDG